jgi:hypothetical protein
MKPIATRLRASHFITGIVALRRGKLFARAT